MGKLTKEQLKYFTNHLEEMEKSKGGRGIYFCFDTIQNGGNGFDALKGIFPDNDFHYGIDKRDFHVMFGSRNKRDAAFDELHKEISEYRQSHLEEVGNNHGENEIPDSSENGSSASNDNSIYIIIGAVAAIIIILLLPWKRK